MVCYWSVCTPLNRWKRGANVQIPDHVWQSVVSAEDRSFFQHPGLDPRGLARAVLFAGTRGGGSTLTQQLVKNLFVSDSKTISRYVAGHSSAPHCLLLAELMCLCFVVSLCSVRRHGIFCRKVFEMAISLALEVHSTKERILETYLQTAYFGHGAFGVSQAATRYFRKVPQKLTLNEAAVLAATLPSPETMSPLRDRVGSAKRLATVLKSMHLMGYISDAQLEKAIQEGLPASLAESAQPAKGQRMRKYLAGVCCLGELCALFMSTFCAAAAAKLLVFHL